jgi:predicted transcriptional regulator
MTPNQNEPLTSGDIEHLRPGDELVSLSDSYYWRKSGAVCVVRAPVTIGSDRHIHYNAFRADGTATIASTGDPETFAFVRRPSDPDFHLSRPSQSAEGQADAELTHGQVIGQSDIARLRTGDVLRTRQGELVTFDYADKGDFLWCDGFPGPYPHDAQHYHTFTFVSRPGIAKPQPLAKADEVGEAAEQLQQLLHSTFVDETARPRLSPDEKVALNTILADHARRKAREAALMEGLQEIDHGYLVNHTSKWVRDKVRTLTQGDSHER